MLERFDAVMEIMLPSLREERAQTYSPFLPISPRNGEVLQVPVTGHDAKAGTITYEDPETKERITTLVTGGRTKLQWKPDWAMRWVALGIDYEMAGKDLIDSVKLSGEICRALGGKPPEGFNYELFLDEKGQKISKSKGNGLTIDEWLRYASPESLSLFMYREPKSAKRLYFDVIPRHVDEYQQYLEAYHRQDGRQRLTNPVWHIHSGAPPQGRHADHVLHAADAGVFLQRGECRDAVGLHRPLPSRRDAADASQARRAGGLCHPLFPRFRAADEEIPRAGRDRARGLDRPARRAVAACRRRRAGEDPGSGLRDRPARAVPRSQEAGQGWPPGVALDWFNMLYQVLLGQEKGPRFGSFVAVYGLNNTVEMIDGALARSA